MLTGKNFKPIRRAASVLVAAAFMCFPAVAQEGGNLGDLLYQGQTALAAREWRDAVAAFERALTLDGVNADALRGLAEAHEGAGDERAALDYYGRLQDVVGKSAEISYKIAFLAEKLGERSRAVTAYEDVVRADPDNLKSWRALADLYAAGGDYKNQAKALEALVARAGDTADRLELAAIYETKLGRADDAVAEYERVLRAEPRDVQAHERLGAIYFGRGDYAPAAEHYEELTRLEPNDADAYWHLAQARLALDDEFGATKALEHVVSLRPRDSAALLLLGTLYNHDGDYPRAERTLKDALDAGAGDAEAYCQLGVAQFGLRDYDQARSSFEKALARDENHQLALERFSELLYREGEPERAYQYADRLVGLSRDNIRGHLYRGLAAAATGRPEAAENSLEKVIKVEPSNVEARVGLGQAYVGREKYRDAKRVLEAAGSPRELADRVYYYLARANEGLKDFEAAATYYRKAEGENPRYYDAFYDHGRMELRRENYDEAERALERATEIDPRRIDAFLSLGELYETTTQWPDAVRAYVRAQDADDRRIESYLGLGRSYIAMEDWKPAERELKRAVEINAESFEAHYQLGRLYKAQDRLDDAVAEYEEAVWLNGKHVRARTDLGYVYLRKDRYGDAAAVLKKACDLDKKDLDAHYLLAIAYENMESYPDAIKYYEKARDLAPGNYDIQTALATCYRHNADFDKALALFDEISREKADEPFAYEMLGDIYRIKGSDAKKWRRFDRELEYYENASDYYRRFLSLAPEAENRVFILKFLDGYEHYRLLQAQEREGVEFYEEW